MLELVQHMLRLLDSGIPIGIATGRGPSVRHAMRHALPPRLYSRVLIGYYSGDQIGNLNQTDCPDQGDLVCDELQPFLAVVDELKTIARVTLRKRQVIAEPSLGMDVIELWRQTSDLIERYSLPNIRVVRSCRSVDILAPSVSKASLLRVGRESWKIPRFCFKPLIYRRESENRPPTPQPSAGNPEHSHQNDLCVPSDMAPTQPVFPD